MMKRSVLFGVACAAGAFSIAGAASAVADDVGAGIDIFTTSSDGTWYDMSGAPIPADFFGPGSDPFSDRIDLVGDPFDPGGPLGTTDTIVRRLDDAVGLDCQGPDVVVDIEIVALSLKSADPITVTFNGGQDPEQWDVRVCLSDVPQGQGQMHIFQCTADGGWFDSTFPLQAKFIFTRVGSPSISIVFDTGLEGIPPDIVQGSTVPWVFQDSEVRTVDADDLRVDGNCDGDPDEPPLPVTSNFVAGVGPNECREDCGPGGMRNRTPIVDVLLWGNHRFGPTPRNGNGDPRIPTVSQWGIAIMALLLLIGGKVYFSRRRATA